LCIKGVVLGFRVQHLAILNVASVAATLGLAGPLHSPNASAWAWNGYTAPIWSMLLEFLRTQDRSSLCQIPRFPKQAHIPKLPSPFNHRESLESAYFRSLAIWEFKFMVYKRAKWQIVRFIMLGDAHFTFGKSLKS
jgi:hypothetical protein